MTITTTSKHNKRSFLTSTVLVVGSIVVGWTPMEVMGMDVVAKKDGWRCESRPIKASLQYLCSQHNSCTLNNEQALIEGECTSDRTGGTYCFEAVEFMQHKSHIAFLPTPASYFQ
jgi:hypothetical protein